MGIGRSKIKRNALKIGIIVPAHNEAEFIATTLESLLRQTYLPEQIVVVDDGSTDNTPNIIQFYTRQYSIITYVRRENRGQHAPGEKVVKTFNEGLQHLKAVDIIAKFDADLIFPKEYLETIVKHYQEDTSIGMCGGFCYIEENGEWVLENLTNADHLRGPIKSYRKECFETIGGLKEAMGWDTVDELLARYHGWKVVTDSCLKVKHLRPTGAGYRSQSHQLQGQMFYTMRYGFVISLLAAIKLAYKKKSFRLLWAYTKGYFKALQQNKPFLVNKEEGQWIRNYRWRGICRQIKRSRII